MSNYRNVDAWLESRVSDSSSSKDAITINYINTNVIIDKIEGKSVCEISFVENSDDPYPPTLQRLMLRNREGEPTVKFASNQDAVISVAGGDFKPVVYDCDFGTYTETVTTYEFSPATLKIEVAPNGSSDFVEITMTEDKAKYVESYGAYMEGTLAELEVESENKWYDLRVTFTDEAGNSQVQTLSPAFYLEKAISGVEMSGNITPGFQVIDGKIISADDSNFSIYSVSGMKMNNLNLPKGIYIVRGNKTQSKIIIK